MEELCDSITYEREEIPVGNIAKKLMFLQIFLNQEIILRVSSNEIACG